MPEPRRNGFPGRAHFPLAKLLARIAATSPGEVDPPHRKEVEHAYQKLELEAKLAGRLADAFETGGGDVRCAGIGVGASSYVFKCHVEEGSLIDGVQAAAFKFMRFGVESTVEAEAKAMLAVEMQGVPGVPRLLGYKKKLVRGKDAILMELIEGRNLWHDREYGLPDEARLEIFSQVLNTLLHLHVEPRVTHNDVASHNMVYQEVEVQGQTHYKAFLIDFGSAKFCNADGFSPPPDTCTPQNLDPTCLYISHFRERLGHNGQPAEHPIFSFNGWMTDSFAWAMEVGRWKGWMRGDAPTGDMPPADKDLHELVSHLAAPTWAGRWSVKDVVNSTFYKNWCASTYSDAPKVTPERLGSDGAAAPAVVAGGGIFGGVFGGSSGLDAAHPDDVAHEPLDSDDVDVTEARTAAEASVDELSPDHGSSDGYATRGDRASRNRLGKRRAETAEGGNTPSFKHARDENGPVRRKPDKTTVLRRRAAGQGTPLSSSSSSSSSLLWEGAPGLGKAPEKRRAREEGENAPSPKQARGDNGAVRREQIKRVLRKRPTAATARACPKATCKSLDQSKVATDGASTASMAGLESASRTETAMVSAAAAAASAAGTAVAVGQTGAVEMQQTPIAATRASVGNHADTVEVQTQGNAVGGGEGQAVGERTGGRRVGGAGSGDAKRRGVARRTGSAQGSRRSRRLRGSSPS